MRTQCSSLLIALVLTGCGSSSPRAETSPPADRACDVSGTWIALGNSQVGEAGLFSRVIVDRRGPDQALCAEHDGAINARITPEISANGFRVQLRADDAALGESQTGSSTPTYGTPAPEPNGCDQALPPTSMSSGSLSTSAPHGYTCEQQEGSCNVLTCAFDDASGQTFRLERSVGN